MNFLDFVFCIFFFFFEEKSIYLLWYWIPGVYNVSIDADEQKVTVTGSVDSAALINKLVRSGKHAELWSPSSNKKQVELFNNTKNQNQTQYLINGLDPSKNQHTSPTFGRVDDDWRSEWYFNQSRGTKTVTGEFNHNLMAAMQNLGLGGDGVTIGDHENFRNKTIPMHDHAGFLGNDAGFAALGGHELGAYGDIYEGLPIYEYDHPLSNMMTSRRVSHYTYPPTDMMNIYM